MNVSPTTLSPWLKALPSPVFKLLGQNWIDTRFPRHLFLETTSACNLSCTFCPREQRRDHMSWDTFRQLVDEASRYGPRSFSLHLFGEPLLYPKWREAIQYIHTQNRRHTVLLTTNGTTLNRHVDDLLVANPSLVLWSWRPEVTFTEATKQKLRKWGRFRVRFIEEVTPKEAYAEWADWPNVEGRALHNYGGNINLSSVAQIPAKAATGSDARVARWPCYHLWLAPAVAWNGNILLCCADPHHAEVLGKFPEMTVAEAWASSKLAAVRTSHLTGQYGGICAGCDVWKQTPDLFFPWQKGR